ncbi:MAG: DUF3810 family protein [Vicinamibacterales bacterium]
MRYRVAVIGLALMLGLVPVSEDLVEEIYSQGLYPHLQHLLTSFSNWFPFALFDVLVIATVAVWATCVWRDARRFRWPVTLGRLGVRTATTAAALYVAFVVAWGLNYRRVPLEAKLALEHRAVTPAAAVRLARLAALELNRLHPGRPPDVVGVNGSLGAAFEVAQARLGNQPPIVPGRPKRTLFDRYFRAASVDGMTDPFFLETLTLSTLLPIERPMIVAHEWAHLAGYADEGEASFVGWVACLAGDAAAQYSAWLFLYFESTSALDPDEARTVAASLEAGPRADLAAIARRVREHRQPLVADVGWGLYDQYLKANGIEQGMRSYTEVVRFVIGTRLGTDLLNNISAPTGTEGAVPRRMP